MKNPLILASLLLTPALSAHASIGEQFRCVAQEKRGLVFTVPEGRQNLLEVRIQLDIRGRMPNGKQWSEASVHKGSIRYGNQEPKAAACELVQYS